MDGEAWRAARDGPPASFVLDNEIYELTGDWSELLGVLPLAEWRMPLLYALLHPADADALDDRLEDEDDPLTLDEVGRVAERLVEQATGRRWWAVQRLYATLADGWQVVNGRLALRGVNISDLLSRPAVLCDTLCAYLTEGADDRAVEQFDFTLSTPPPGVDLDDAPLWTAEEEGASFLAAMNAPGVKGGRIGGTVA